jgi:hypothetical protein
MGRLPGETTPPIIFKRLHSLEGLAFSLPEQRFDLAHW